MRQANFASEIAAPECAASATAQPVPRPFLSLAAMVERAAAAAGLRRGGFLDDARRAATPNVVDCLGLSRENLDEPYLFEFEFHQRRAWCENSGGLCEIEPIRDQETFVLTGYRFRFAGLSEATFFKLRFDMNL
jgi:hypothetical protein